MAALGNHSVALRCVFALGVVCGLTITSSWAAAINYTKNTQTFPNCVEMTFNLDEFRTSSDGQLQLLADNDVIIENTDYTMSSDNKSVHVCYPLSEEFLRCHSKLVLPMGKYRIEGNRSISDERIGQSWDLGNFFIQSDGGAVVCVPCSYIKFKKNEYKLHSENQTFVIVASGKMFYSPKYSIDNVTLMANVCYPIPSFRRCLWGVVEEWYASILPDKSLLDKETSRIFDLDNYIATSDGKVAICINAYEPDSLTISLKKICIILDLISAACLAVAIVVHLAVPELSFQRAPLIFHSFCLMVVYIWLVFRHFYRDYEADLLEMVYPVFLVMYIFGLSSFAWLTVLAFDCWRITSHLRNGGEGYRWADRFCSLKTALYAMFGFGFSLAFAGFVMGLETNRDFQDWIGLHPQISKVMWFNEFRSSLALWYGPMGVLLAVNFIFFVLSIINLYRANSDNKPFVNVKLNQQLLAVLFVVFLAMGLFWVMEILSFLDFPNEKRWFFADFVNSSQGIIIAAVYTCSPLFWKTSRWIKKF
ncbi:hypothetical protein CHUAL_009804 [Chamberlinius hualienensis]